MKMFYGLDSKRLCQRAASGMVVWNDTLRLSGGGRGLAVNLGAFWILACAGMTGDGMGWRAVG